MDINKKLKPINRKDANLEAEKGETVISKLFGVNIPEHYIIEGEKHSKGGTPLKLPKDSFIFSNSNKLRIVDKDILDNFDMPYSKRGYTPAEIAKKYSINEYKAKLLDPNIDKIERDSAILMLNNRFDKLSELAIIQESMKGFPNGIPNIALAYLEKNNIKPEELLPDENDANIIENNLKEQKKYVLGSSVKDDVTDTNNDTGYIPPNQKPIITTQEQLPKLIPPYLSEQFPILNTNNNSTNSANNSNNSTNIDLTNKYWNANAGVFMMDENQLQNNPTVTSLNQIQKGKEISTPYKSPMEELINKTTYKDSQNNTTNNANKTKKQSGLSYVLPGFQIAANTYLNLSANEMKRREQAIQERQLLDRFNPEDASPYTTSTIGDYVETGTQYGSFNPTSQTYAVNPQNMVTNKINMEYGGQPKFPHGGEFTDKEKEEVKKRLNIKKEEDEKNIVFVEDGNVDNITDYTKLYVYKDKNGKIKYRRFQGDASNYFSDNDNNISDKERTIKSYKKGIDDSIAIINTKIDALTKERDKITDENEKKKYEDKLEKLNILKIQFEELSNGLSDNNFIEKYITGESEHEPFISTKLNKKQIEQLQEMYKSNDIIFNELGLQMVTPGFNEKNELKGISPIDGIKGNTTFFYGALPKNAFTYKGIDTDININKPQLDTSGVKDLKQITAYNPFFTQDINNLNLALSEKARIKKYIPYQSVPDTFLPDATFVSPERAIAANQETTNMLSNAASTLGDSNTYAATASLLAGQAFANNANIVGQTHNTNVGIANNNENIRTQILNNASAQKANLSTSLFDKATIANQQFDNAMLAAQRNIVRAINNAWTNRGLAQQMNATSDKFNIDPLSYMVYRKENSDTTTPIKDTDPLLTKLDKINTALGQYKFDDDTKKAIIEAYLKSDENKTTNTKITNTTPFTFNPFE